MSYLLRLYLCIKGIVTILILLKYLLNLINAPISIIIPYLSFVFEYPLYPCWRAYNVIDYIFFINFIVFVLYILFYCRYKPKSGFNSWYLPISLITIFTWFKFFGEYFFSLNIMYSCLITHRTTLMTYVVVLAVGRWTYLLCWIGTGPIHLVFRLEKAGYLT